MARKISTVAEVAFGDFQTPAILAGQVTHLLRTLGLRPRAILEPTCGKGSFLNAAQQSFPEADCIFGVELNPDYVAVAKLLVSDKRTRVLEADFFKVDWSVIFAQSQGPWMILGNPPWVTNSVLGSLDSSNLPQKDNTQGLAGIEAITGKSNFDISEWMLLKYLDWLEAGWSFAVLCKSAVARKVLSFAWGKDVPIGSAKIFKIDADLHFGVSVDACLFIVQKGLSESEPTCGVYNSLSSTQENDKLSFIDGQLIQSASGYLRGRHLLGGDKNYRWRSGIKHDCSKIMELSLDGDGYVNGYGERLKLEDSHLYPMCKSSGIGSAATTCRRMIVSQRFPGEDYTELCANAPNIWQYLQRHKDLFRKRASSIYKNKGDFAIFGVGPYSFSPWKVAISGFYKHLKFFAIGPVDNRPVVFDDTVYYISCYSELEATFLADMANSESVVNVLGSLIHWSNKRPITADILNKLDFARIARDLGRYDDYDSLIASRDAAAHTLGTFGLLKSS